VCDANQLAPPVAFLHLPVDQLRCHLPPEYFPASTTNLEPLAKVGSEGIEGAIEPVTGKEREAVSSQDLSQGVDNPMGHVLWAGTELKHRKNRGEGIDG
jgi:hypothetical protein